MNNLTEEQLREIIREELALMLSQFLFKDKYVFHKTIQILDGRKIILGTANGSMLGTESTQKIGFLGKSPVSQQSTITDPTGGGTVDAQARTAINSLIDLLQAYGLMA